MKKKLNVFFSNSISSHKWGGGEKWMITAAKGLSDRGHNVMVSGKSNSIFLFKAKENNLNTIPFNFLQDYNPLKIWYTKKILIKEDIDVIILNLKKDIRVAGISANWTSFKPKIFADFKHSFFVVSKEFCGYRGGKCPLITNKLTLTSFFENLLIDPPNPNTSSSG